ncbi:type II secretion system protein J [Candidatus Omnitrophota bacterium]
MKRKVDRKGFTLIEMIITMLIVGIVGGVGVASMLSATDAVSFLTIRSDMDQSADVALSRMSQDIRRINEDAGILIATPTQLWFKDVDGTTIVYALSSPSLFRFASFWAILASDVDSLTFTYYDDANNEIADITEEDYGHIRWIKVHLTFQQGSYVLDYETKVRPRNLRHLAYKFSGVQY